MTNLPLNPKTPPHQCQIEPLVIYQQYDMDKHNDEKALANMITTVDNGYHEDSEREALTSIVKPGFHYRPPPPPHMLTSYITHEDSLFQTIHMGPIVVDKLRWFLVINGMVCRPFIVTFTQLLQFPKKSVTAFHECYGSPIKPPIENLWRIGNVTWTGVALKTLIDLAKPLPDARYVWSDGLDRGSFANIDADRYQKDLPLSKAMMDDTIVAYEMNGEPLGHERGGPVRLIVPGWYGTNSTKWLCKLSLQAYRSQSPFTTTLYNEIDPTDPEKKRKRPCWDVEPNAFILTEPSSEGSMKGPNVTVKGRAWSACGIGKVSILVREDGEWQNKATVHIATRRQYEWQDFGAELNLEPGEHEVMARATDTAGTTQPLNGRRNHVHRVRIFVK